MTSLRHQYELLVAMSTNLSRQWVRSRANSVWDAPPYFNAITNWNSFSRNFIFSQANILFSSYLIPCYTVCLFPGDIRVNDVPTLTSVHQMGVKEHNRLAWKFRRYFKDQETLFQVTFCLIFPYKWRKWKHKQLGCRMTLGNSDVT